MASKVSSNGETLARISQKIDDHVVSQTAQFAGIDKRLDEIECEVRAVVTDRAMETSKLWKTLLPVVVSLLIVGGGWVWGLSRQEAKITELENGRFENKGNIQVLMKQVQESQISDAQRDARYEAILEKLSMIQKQLDQIHRNQK